MLDRLEGALHCSPVVMAVYLPGRLLRKTGCGGQPRIQAKFLRGILSAAALRNSYYGEMDPVMAAEYFREAIAVQPITIDAWLSLPRWNSPWSAWTRGSFWASFPLSSRDLEFQKQDEELLSTATTSSCPASPGREASSWPRPTGAAGTVLPRGPGKTTVSRTAHEVRAAGGLSTCGGSSRKGGAVEAVRGTEPGFRRAGIIGGNEPSPPSIFRRDLRLKNRRRGFRRAVEAQVLQRFCRRRFPRPSGSGRALWTRKTRSTTADSNRAFNMVGGLPGRRYRFRGREMPWR